MAGNHLIELGAELGDVAALGDGLGDGLVQVVEQIRPHGAGHDEGVIVLGLCDGVPGVRGKADLLLEEGELLREGLVEADAGGWGGHIGHFTDGERLARSRTR